MTILDYIIANPNATDAEVSAALTTTTYAAFDLDDLEAWTVIDGRRARLRAASVNPAIPEELRIGLLDLLDALASPRLEHMDLAQEQIRQRWLGGAAALSMIGVLSPTESAELAAMGRTDTVVTVEQVAAARLDQAKQTKRQALANAFNDRIARVEAATSVSELEAA
jgi:hypothetical protein